jgi:hypothetical protein
MNFFRAFFGLFLSLIFVSPVFSGEVTSLMKLRFGLDSAQYIFDVSDVQVHANATSRLLRIACVSGCQSVQYFEEKIDDTPIGVVRVSDSMPIIVTTWARGSAYYVRVYSYGSGVISKVFERGSLGVPNASAIGNDRIEIVVFERDEKSDKISRNAWRIGPNLSISPPK